MSWSAWQATVWSASMRARRFFTTSSSEATPSAAWCRFCADLSFGQASCRRDLPSPRLPKGCPLQFIVSRRLMAVAEPLKWGRDSGLASNS